jgi:hypothetical protein
MHLLCGKSLSNDGPVGTQDLFKFAKDFPLAHRTALVKTAILIRVDPVTELDHADLPTTNGNDAATALGDLGQGS